MAATGFFIFALVPSMALAQSSISGTAKDSTGAVMVGVSVEAASPALIEGKRMATSSGDGRYAIVDVRPGVYTMTFTMPGFATTIQQVEVPSDTTVTVDASLKPGSVGETVNVDARVATVDIQNAAHPAVLSREDMDLVPTARNVQSLGSLVPGIHLNTPDVGGSMQVQQTYITSHGNDTWNTIWNLDGILINVTQSDGQIQAYVDNALIQETTYQTSAIGADSSAGGVLVNMIPKEGGNTYNADIFMGWVPSRFVGTNVTPLEITRGVAGQSRVNQIQDFDGSFGGPILKNKLWFSLTGRKQLSNLESPGSLYANGSPGIENDYIYTGSLRLTWQINAKNKISIMDHRMWKTIKDDIVSGSGGFNDSNPDISSNHRDPVMYYIAQTRWTGTLTPRLILQAGFGIEYNDYYVSNQPGVLLAPSSAAAIAAGTELDTSKLSRSVAGGVNNFYKFERYAYNVTGQYVAGSHQAKFGLQDSFGPAYANTLLNGDAIYNYQNGVPVNITAYDTPTYSKPHLDHDLGIYLMDTWNYRRLSVTGGIRWEYLDNHIEASTAPAGRFVGARNFPRIDCSTNPGISCFKDWSPRLGLVFDLFGDHKTALKAGFGKYNSPLVSGNLNAFNPMFLATQTITWVNAPTTACQVTPGQTLSTMTTGNPGCFPLGNTFGQGNIGPNPNLAFGLLPSNHDIDPNYHREYNWQFSAGVQRELYRGVTLNANWNHRIDYQQITVNNLAVPGSAWTPQTITNPLDGSPITLFNLNSSFAGITPALHQTNAPHSLRNNVYNGYELSANARLPRKITLFGGWSLDKMWDRTCDMPTTSTNYNDPNTLRFCDQSGGNLTVGGINVNSLGQVNGVPYRNEFKASGNIPIKWGFEGALSLYNAPVSSTNYTNQLGNFLGQVRSSALFTGAVQGFSTVNWSVGPTTKYPTDCNCGALAGTLVDPSLKQGTEVIQLVAPGALLTPRITQLDVTLRRKFRFREKYTLSAEVTMFNATNQSAAITESESLGTNNVHLFMNSAQCSTAGNPTNCGIGGTPSVITNPRMFRLSTQFKF
jgi:Carboxypeptidase regulatory-like domain